MHNPGGKEVEHELQIARLDGMSRIGAPLEPHHDVRVRRHVIHHLGFAFISHCAPSTMRTDMIYLLKNSYQPSAVS